MPREFNPETRKMLPLHLVALEFARDMIGVREVTENWGPEIKEFLKAANVNVPAPWCAGLVNWCGEQAAKLKGVESPLEAVRLQAYVQSYYQLAVAGGHIIPPEEVGPGDLFMLWYSSLQRYAHIGFVDGLVTDTYPTIEGNTNKAGEREGTLVKDKVRPLSSTVKFVRWV